MTSVKQTPASPAYNSRILRMYIEYLEHHHPKVDIDALLEAAGLQRYAIDDAGEWFSQEQVNRFHRELKKIVTDPELPRKAGRYASRSASIGAFRQYLLGLVNPAAAYLLMGHLYAIWSRAATASTRRIDTSTIEVDISPAPGAREAPFQCSNRIGSFESLAAVYTGKFARIDHPLCIHRGDECCRYHISWERTPVLLWKQLRNLSWLLAFFALLTGAFVFSPPQLGLTAIVMLMVVLGCTLLSEHFEKKELIATVEAQGNTAADLLKALELRRNEAVLAAEIGRLTTAETDPRHFKQRVASLISHHLDYDKCFVMVPSPQGNGLCFAAGTGLPSHMNPKKVALTDVPVNARRDGLLHQVMEKRSPFITSRGDDQTSLFSDGEKAFIRASGLTSFIMLPIAYEEQVLGALVVERKRQNPGYGASDLDFLKGVAAQVASSLITARALKKLRDSEERYRLLAENAADVIWVIDLDTMRFTYISPSVYRLRGMSPHEVMEERFEDSMPAESLAKIQATIAKGMEEALRDPGKVFEKKLILQQYHKDGSLIWVEIAAAPLYDEASRPVGVIGVSRDITDRQNMEQALEQQEEKYRTLFESSLDAVYIFSGDRCLLEVNPAALKLHGLTRSQLQEDLVTDLYRSDGGTVMDSFFETVSEGVDFQQQARGWRADGKPFDAELHGSSCTVQHTRLLFLTARDISFRKAIEREKLSIQKQLSRSKKMKALGLLAGSVAHDLNNILSGIVSYPDLLLLDLPEDSPLRQPIQTIGDAGKRAADVVADLVTVTRGAAISKSVTNLNDIVRDFLASPEFEELLARYPKTTVATVLDPELLNIRCSVVHVRKALMNLVVNAAEAMESGGRLTITTRNRYQEIPAIDYTRIEQGEWVLLEVSDEGPGISPEERERIFEPFYTRKVMGRSGTGLGLTVVWNTVQDHGGRVDVLGDDRGTRFRLYFPVTRERVEEILSPAAQEITGKGESILVIDDEPAQRDIACRLLQRLGYKAVAVASGEAALEHLRQEPADLLLLDMIMDPGINGRETYEQALSIAPGQKAVIASGFSETDDVRRALAMGAAAFIRKPYTLEVLATAVRDALEN
jgi:PAS domain S-box-containing protein